MTVQPLRRAAARSFVGVGVAAAVIVAVAGCSTSSPSSSTGSSTKIAVVAAENFWGSIATQLGGDHATVTNIINKPDTDPHAYEPTPADGRAVTSAQYVIVNGVGYDSWAPKLIATNANPQRTVLTVGDLVGLKEGDNPHRWYSPADVNKVIDQIITDYKKLDPADASYFDQQKQKFTTQTLAKYNQALADIKSKYAGTPIGASESIVSPLSDYLGLTMLTPAEFLKAISEGTDPSAADKATIDQQIKGKQIKVYIYNSQNSTPDVKAQVDAATAAGIPTATVTETLTPADATFQDWQTTQLQGIATALAKATGK